MKIEALLQTEETNVSHRSRTAPMSVKTGVDEASKMQNDPRKAIDGPREVEKAATIAINGGWEMQNALHFGLLGPRKLKMHCIFGFR